MVHLIAFQTEENLSELTGLSHDELWDAGFNLDDWDAGFQSDVKLHAEPDKELVEDGTYDKGELLYWDSPCFWLMSQMANYCVGASYTEYKGKHYYMVHHA